MKKTSLVIGVLLFSLFACQKEKNTVIYDNESSLSLCTKSETYNPQTIMEHYSSAEPTESFYFPNGLEVQKVDNLYILGGDIIFPQKMVDSLLLITPSRSAVSTVFNKFWHRGIIYYSINPSLINTARITNAMNLIQQQTSIQFVERTTEVDYIEFVSTDIENTYIEGIGRIGGKQRINLADWATYGNVIHELCHGLGLYHEHTRQDRDAYVDVIWQNIPDKKKSQYYQYNITTGTDVGSFDFNSIMLYGSYLDDNIAMRKKDSSLFYSQRIDLSTGDIAGIQYIYGPPYSKLTNSIESFEENTDGGYGYENYSCIINNTLYFYDDKFFNNPTSTSSPRILKIKYKLDTTIDESPYIQEEYVFDLIIPLGITSFPLPNTTYEYISEYGYVRYEKRETYSVVGVGY